MNKIEETSMLSCQYQVEDLEPIWEVHPTEDPYQLAQ